MEDEPRFAPPPWDALPEPVLRSVRRAWDALDREPWEMLRRSLRRELRAHVEPALSIVALRCAQSVLPMWEHAASGDLRGARLVEDIARVAEGDDPIERALRDELSRTAIVADRGLTARRALVLAHDVACRVGETEERCDLDELCAWAWVDAPLELVPSARSGDPMARAEAWFRWYLAFAVPEAVR